jgi:hypothetical protein
MKDATQRTDARRTGRHKPREPRRLRQGREELKEGQVMVMKVLGEIDKPEGKE